MNIVEIAVTNEDLDIPDLALGTAGLVETIQNSTCSSPQCRPRPRRSSGYRGPRCHRLCATDAAFVALAQDPGFAGSDEAGALDAIVPPSRRLALATPN